MHIRRNNVFCTPPCRLSGARADFVCGAVVALTKRNVNASEILCYLSKLVDVSCEIAG